MLKIKVFYEMTNTNEVLGVLAICCTFILSLAVAFFSWRYADYFMSRKDHYVNSRYQLFIRKIGWAGSAFLISFGLMASLLKTILVK